MQFAPVHSAPADAQLEPAPAAASLVAEGQVGGELQLVGDPARALELRCCRGMRVGVAGECGAARLESLRDCDVELAARGSVVVRDCSNCRLVLRAAQLRLHTCLDCTLLLDVAAASAIEHCSGLRIACLPGGGPAWREVADFDWLDAGTPSPHYQLLPSGGC
jgi:hypothetical protein